MPAIAPRLRLPSQFALAVLVSLSAGVAREVSAQEPEPEAAEAEALPPTVAPGQQAAIERLLDSEQWDAAASLLAPLVESLNYYEQTDELDELRCVEQVVNLRTANEYGSPANYFILPKAFARKGNEAQRHACARRLGLAYAAALTRPNLPDTERARAAENAAFWLHDALTLRPSAALRRLYAELPPETHKLVQSLPALRMQSLRNAVGERPSLEALASAVDRIAWLRDPTRNMHCYYDAIGHMEAYEDSTGLSVLECNHGRESFVVEPTPSGALRIMATIRDRDYGWCGTGMSHEHVSHTQLTPREHGFDGYLVVWNFTQQDAWRAVDEQVGSTTATICSRKSGTCRHTPVGASLCISHLRGPEANAGEDPPCVSWQGVPEVKNGKLRLRPPAHDGKPHSAIPRAYAGPIDLHSQFGSLEPSDAATPAHFKDACWLRVSSPDSPLNVRESPSASAKVLTTLADGALTRALEQRAGFYRIAHPQAGWVWAKSVTNACKTP